MDNRDTHTQQLGDEPLQNAPRSGDADSIRCLLETVPLGVAECDARGAITWTNPAYQRMIGYSRDELAEMHVADLLADGPQKDSIAEHFQHLVSNQPEPTPYVCRDVTKSGRIIDVQVDWAYKRGAQGEVIGFISVISDISERKRAEATAQAVCDDLERRVAERTAELEKANKELEILRLFAESATQCFGITDLEGTILYANPAMCRIQGVARREDLIGQSILTRGRSLEFMRDVYLPELLRTGRWEEEGVVVRPDGTRVPIWNSSIVIRNEAGEPIYLSGVLSDITEQVRIREALKQAHDELQTIYDGMLDGLIIADLITKKILQVNPAVCRMLGYTAAELFSMTVTEIHPSEEISAVDQRFTERAAGKRFPPMSTVFQCKDGSLMTVEVISNTLTYRGRRCVAGFFRDVAEKLRAEKALERERRNLRRLLQASDRERQLIAYEIHDGLAQQLAGAIMQFQVFDHAKLSDTERAAKVFEAGMNMLRQCHFETRRLIADVRPPILDESGIAEAIAHLVHEQRREKGLRIEYSSKVAFDRLVPALENALFRICQEALTNACRHAKSPRVRIRLSQRDDRLRLAVRDWGVGFDVKGSRLNRFGLEGIRQRAKLLGGRCSIRSALGRGTQIVVELPVVQREENP